MNRRLGTVAIVLMALTALAGVLSYVFWSKKDPQISAMQNQAVEDPASPTSSTSSSSSPSSLPQPSAPFPSSAPEGQTSTAILPNQPQDTSANSANSPVNRATQRSAPAASTPRRSIADILKGVDLSKPGERERVVAEIKAIEEQRRAAAVARAKELGLPVRIEKAGGGVSEVADIDENGQLLYRTTRNASAAISTAANLIRQTVPYNLSGNGIKVGIWDGGLVRNTHVEFGTNRVLQMDSAALNDHATHVAGTLGATGVSPNAKGMAPNVAIDSYDWNSDNAEMLSAGAVTSTDMSMIPISNHSYGLTTQTNDTAFMGRYTSEAAQNDDALDGLPFYLPFWAAGNDQTRLNAKQGFQSITFEALAKNIVTVGNVNDAVLNNLRSPTNGTMSSSSSWGPSDDGRIKPDLVANGINVYSTTAASDTSYDGSYSGTSMASPNAAGSAVLLVELYKQLFSNQFMRASLLKGLLIHTADDLGNPGPDYKFGWGLINVKAAADLMHTHRYVTAHPKWFEQTLTRSTTTRNHTFQWDGSSPIRATLCWTDPPGAAQADDSRAAVLRHNLDLKITAPNGTTVYQPYVMPFVGTWTDASMNSPATTGKNNVDNVEQVYIASPTLAGTYTVTVSLDGNFVTGVNNQPYSLVLSGSSMGTAPTISNIPDQTVNVGNSIGPIAFTIGDAETPANSLVLSAASSNPALVPDAGITLAGSGTNRTISIVPASGVTGATTITVTVHDGGVTTSDSFVLTVNPAPDIAVEELRGSDSSSSSAYGDNLFIGRNGGSGFGSWSGSTTGAGGRYIGATSVRSRSFAVYAGSGAAGNSAQATRSLSTPLAVGESLAVQLGYTSVGTGGEIGVNFFSGGSFRLGLKFIGGSDQWVLNDGGSNFGTGIGWAGGNPSGGTPLQVLFRRNAGNGYSIMLVSGSRSFAGVGYNSTTGTMSIDSIQFYSSSQGADQHLGFDDLTRGLDVITGSPFDLGSVLFGSSGTAKTFLVRNLGGATLSDLTLSKSGSHPDDFILNGTLPSSIAPGSGASFQLTWVPSAAGSRAATITLASNDPDSATLNFSLNGTVAKASANVTISDTNQTYNGSARPVTVATSPTNLPVTTTYNGGSSAPTNAGTYTVVATVTDSNYEGSATNTLTVAPASASVSLSGLSQTYDGTARTVTATTSPTNLPVTITYDESSNAPTNVGSYTVVATVSDSNYQGSTTNTLAVAKASATVNLGNLTQTYSSSPRSVTVTTDPPALAVSVTYDGSPSAPSEPGVYAAAATITDPNYQGGTSATLTITGLDDPQGDTNGDSIPNLVEYALATNSTGSVLPILLPPTNGVLTLTAIVRTNDNGLTFTAHGVTNLLEYTNPNSISSIAGTPSPDTNNVGAGFQRQEFRYTNNASRAFLKLTIQQQ